MDDFSVHTGLGILQAPQTTSIYFISMLNSVLLSHLPNGHIALYVSSKYDIGCKHTLADDVIEPHWANACTLLILVLCKVCAGSEFLESQKANEKTSLMWLQMSINIIWFGVFANERIA